MGPLLWVIVFLISCLLVSLIAAKKGRSGTKFFLSMTLPVIPLMLFVSLLLGSNMEAKPTALFITAFLFPVVGFFVALMANNREQMAVQEGVYGDYKKCPNCAESVRKEAIKCKHCHSDLSPQQA